MRDARPDYTGKELEALSVAVNYHRWILDEVGPYLGETVAEVGAGIGSVSELILERNVGMLLAFEPSGNLYPLLADKLKHERRAEAINDFFGARNAGAELDSVAYINVLEHIKDDGTELQGAAAALKRGGHLIVFVPALEWLYSDFDRQIGHYRRYEKSGLVRLVSDAGLTIVKAQYFDVAGIIPWYVNFVLLRNSIGSRGVSLYDTLVVPTMRRIEKVVPPPAGKNLLVVARKN
jgi:SAM-dependent methyltransferase